MIDEIRSYVKQTVYDVDSSLRWDGFVFGTDAVSTNNIENEFKMTVGDVTPALIDTTYRANVPVSITIYKALGNDQESAYNNLFCKAIDIIATAMDKTRISQDDYIKNVLGTTASPVPIEDNDNMMQVNIQLDLEVYFQSK